MTQPQCDQSCHKCLASFTKDDPSVIRAVGYLYHRDCFLCDACQVPVLKKFYVLQFDDNVSTTSNDSLKDIILCENDYYYQCNYKCHQCHQSITNDHYRTINEYKYHMNCISCLGCSIVQNFGSTTSLPCQPHHSNTDYHGYNDRIYCRYHYSLIRGTECIGCNQTILDQHSELNNDRGGKWHPECYMIEKYWQVQLKDLPCFQGNNNYMDNIRYLSPL
ncbi:hypothetical protein BDB01DRAFT_566660 [Pilobolus umbonatus]|nr:hypothetical protein BDB01DRAFT_566660 [Pilobolus umbonatus]